MGSPEIPLMQFGAINTGRYKAGAVPQSTNMYSWPMNNYWVTNFNADQMGELQWSYFINSSKDNSIGYATLGEPHPVPDPRIAGGSEGKQSRISCFRVQYLIRQFVAGEYETC